MDPQHFALLDEARRSLPDGFKAEISGDTIVMLVGPSGIHQRNLLVVRRQFDAHCPGDLHRDPADLLLSRCGRPG